MNVLKDLEYPLRLTKLERSFNRILYNHPARTAIEKAIYITKAGYRGEKEVAYQLERLSELDCYVLYGLRIEHNGFVFQIDALLITRKFLLIIEAKNMYGTIFFDTTFNQMIRRTNELEEGFRNALTQIAYHEEQLQLWLITNGFGDLPIESLVAFSSPSTILKTNDQTNFVYEKVIHADSLVGKIRKLDQQYAGSNFESFDPEILYQTLLNNHIPPTDNPFQEFMIDKADLLTGVQCPTCSRFQMKRKHGMWICPGCNTTSINAHKEAIMDYLILINPTISNKQCRAFLHLDSLNTAKFLLSSMNLSSYGKTKGRRYYLPILSE